MSVLPDAERIVTTFLRSRSEVAALVDDRVYAEIPRKVADRVFPLVRVSRTGGGPTESPLHMDRAILAVDVWGGTKFEAQAVAAAIMAVLDDIGGYSAHGGYSTGSSLGTLRYVPDESFEPPRPRYIVDFVSYFRPVP